jgi:hypothetical protein
MFPRVFKSSRIGLAYPLLVVFVGLLFVTSVTAVQAQDADKVGPIPNDKVCVEGSVIDHAEKLLTDGWIIGATPRNEQGELNPTRAVSEVSDANGNFRFDEWPGDPNRGIFVGDWQFQIDLNQKDGQDWEPVTPDRFDLSLDFGEDECVKIRFKLRRLVKITVIKVNEEYEKQAGWRIHAEPGPGNIFAAPQELVTDDTGTVVFRLSPGRWIFTESAPAGASYTPVLPVNGTQEVDVQTAATLYFKNRIRFKGCIDVFKHDVLPDNTQLPLPGWLIQVVRTNGAVAASGLTGLDGKVSFDGLAPGPYQVIEENRLGWKPLTPTTFTVNVVGGGHCEVVTFFNAQDEPQFCIEGVKIDSNGKIGIPGWKIWAEALDAGSYLPTPVLTDGEGEYSFVFPEDDYRVPGARYKICEEQKAGWQPHTPICYVVQLPQEPGECVKVPVFENQQKGHDVEEPEADHPKSDDRDCEKTHVVKHGEGLYSIGRQYGVSPQAMLSANPWVRNQKYMYVYVGQQICIP